MKNLFIPDARVSVSKYETYINFDDVVSRHHDLKTWITDLPADLRKVPINKLSIPGSHNGLTYKINSKSKIALDCNDAVKRLSFISKFILARWSACQKVSIMKQLESGVRYFDLRVQYESDKSNFWCVYLMKAELLHHALLDIDRFLKNHPNEIVILDFQHFLNFTDRQQHLELICLLHDLFGNRLCPERSISDVTVEWLNSVKHQIIVVYRNDMCKEANFFNGCRFPVVYPIASNPEEMMDSMTTHVARSSSTNWCLVIQTVLKPDRRMVLRYPFANVRNKCAKSVLPHILTFLLSHPKPNHPNVIVADFVELNNAAFPRAVVDLNYDRFGASGSSLINKLRKKPPRKGSQTQHHLPYWKSSLESGNAFPWRSPIINT